MKTEEQRLLDELYDRNNRIVSYHDYSEDKNSNQTSLNFQNYPDAKKHQIVSFIKSGIRIVGYCFIPISLPISASLLILSEAVGIYEELV